jgi:hypothetical protein
LISHLLMAHNVATMGATDIDSNDEVKRTKAFDLNDLPPEFLDNPFPTYHLLRRHDPVHLNPDESYFLTRYDDVAAVYRDPRFSSDKQAAFKPKFGTGALYGHHTTSLVFRDPPDHTRLRNLIAPAFMPRPLAALAPKIDRVVDQLLDRAEDAGEMDIITDLAGALPIEVVGDMLGVPLEDREPLRGWSLAILGALEPKISDEALSEGNRAVEEFSDYLIDLIARRRQHPNDDPSDILGALIDAMDQDAEITEFELIQNCIFLLNAGHETTTNLIGNGIACLLADSGEMQRLREDPGLIKSAIEEFLRYESSNQIGNRVTTETVTIGGIEMSPGTQVALSIGGANRDPAQFPDPDRLDISRAPNRHLAFAAGIHACAGMTLARMEGQAAISRLLHRFPNLRPNGSFVRGGRARFRGYASYPIAL